MGGFPAWSCDETLLALWTAASHGPHVAVDDPAVTNLSLLFRSASPARARNRRYRNRHGVARKIWSFLALLEGRPTGHLTSVMELIWRDFADHPDRLAIEAGRARRRLADKAAGESAPSRGPPPAPRVAIFRCNENGPSWVYAAALEGIVVQPGAIFVKIGHSNDVARRENDLNFPLPRRSGLRWSMIASWALPNSTAAYFAEQAILQSEAAAGHSAGGEFLLIKANSLGELLERCARSINEQLGDSGIGPRQPRSRQSCRRRRSPTVGPRRAVPRRVELRP